MQFLSTVVAHLLKHFEDGIENDIDSAYGICITLGISELYKRFQIW